MKVMEDKYKEMLEQQLIKIDEIDAETPWQNFEPNWWLDMMEIRKLIRSKLNKTN